MCPATLLLLSILASNACTVESLLALGKSEIKFYILICEVKIYFVLDACLRRHDGNSLISSRIIAVHNFLHSCRHSREGWNLNALFVLFCTNKKNKQKNSLRINQNMPDIFINHINKNFHHIFWKQIFSFLRPFNKTNFPGINTIFNSRANRLFFIFQSI
jgi:hypothetical protein